jgi:hypothetical protein
MMHHFQLPVPAVAPEPLSPLLVPSVLLLCRQIKLIVSLVLLGRQDVIEAAQPFNLQTLAIEPEEANQHVTAWPALVVPLLKLSEQQEELTAVGMHLYYEQLAATHQERRDIDQLMTVVVANEHSSSGSSTPEAALGSFSSCNSSEQLESLPDRQELLEKQQELISRLNLLLHKEVSRAGTVLARWWHQHLPQV